MIIDTSGSIIEEINAFMSEIGNAQEFPFNVIQVDKSVTLVGEYKMGNGDFQVYGGGKLTFSLPWICEQQLGARIVIFTDGT